MTDGPEVGLTTVDQDEETSIVFHMLPLSVQSKMPAFYSLRKSVSLSILSSLSFRRSTTLADGTDPKTPSPPDSVSDVGSEDAALSSSATLVELLPSRSSSRPSTRPPSPNAKDITRASARTDAAGAGVKRKYADLGSHLMDASRMELQDPMLERKSYIDGLIWELRALPDELDEEELDGIRRAMPRQLLAPDACGPAMVEGSRQRQGGWRVLDKEPTLLHLVVQVMVARFLFALHWLWRGFLFLAQLSLRYEQQYNISQLLVTRGFILVNLVGRHGMMISGRICSMGDGRLGQAVTRIAGWTVDNVAAGIQDGVGDGLLMIGFKEGQQ